MTELIHVPPDWERLSLDFKPGALFVVGAPDVGKSTLARFLHRRLCEGKGSVAFLDGDPGQSSLGPPATMTAALPAANQIDFPPRGRIWRWFVGSVSPRGHMLNMLVAAARLAAAVRKAGATHIIYDTSGLVDPASGGLALKWAKIDLLQPVAIFALQRERELEPLLAPLRRTGRARIIELPASPYVRPRDMRARRAHRARQFARYFASARSQTLHYRHLAIFPKPDFRFQQLVALESKAGFVLGLGVVQRVDLAERRLTLITPLTSFARVAALRLGDLLVDPISGHDEKMR
ncbi:MAG: hypothetical protein GXP42_03355 [Chloroflexi bacterium]|nr:hypothetical protein [Chloroflexota bacterium]